MRLLRFLQHWLTGTDRPLRVAEFVPDTHPVRQWADTFPWPALVAAVDRHIAQHFPTPTARGRPPVATRVLLALELLKHELHCSDEQICSQLRTDLAVMYACGIAEVQVNRAQAHFVLPELLTQFRSRLDEALLQELLAIPAAAAIEEGAVSPAHVVVDTFPSEQGSQRVNDAATLYKAKKKSSSSSPSSRSNVRPRGRRCRSRRSSSSRNWPRLCAALGDNAEARGKSLCPWCAKRKPNC